MFPCQRIANRISPCWAIALTTVVLTWSLLGQPPATCALYSVAGADVQTEVQDNARLEQFLARLGLVDLRIQLLERSLRSPEPADAKQPMARQLADLYAERLMSNADDPAKYSDTLQRIETLVRDFPDANTTALRVMLLQADYNR